MAKGYHSLETPVCAGSLLTAMQYERSVVIAEVEAANMSARMSVTFLCEFSPQHRIFIPFNKPLLTCTATHCTLFHVLYYG
jgi:hypothetical protein